MRLQKLFFMVAAVLWLSASTQARRAEDFPAAKELAKSEGADILVFYHGGEWCRAGEQLKSRVWNHQNFEAALPKLVLLAIKQSDLPDEAQKQRQEKNKALFKAWQPWNFPGLALFDSEGRLVATREGLSVGMQPAEFIATIKAMVAIREKRDQCWGAETNRSREQAVALGKGLDVLEFSIASRHYKKTLDKIKKLDPKDRCGYVGVYEFKTNPFIEGKIHPLKRKGLTTHQEVIAELDTMLENPVRPIWQQQEIWAMKSAVYAFWSGQEKNHSECLEKIIALDPESDMATGARRQLESDYKRAW